MPIRLNRAQKVLNVGIKTLVEALRRKGETVEENPNVKISDEQYALLQQEFKKDGDLKALSDSMRNSRMHSTESANSNAGTDGTASSAGSKSAQPSKPATEKVKPATETAKPTTETAKPSTTESPRPTPTAGTRGSETTTAPTSTAQAQPTATPDQTVATTQTTKTAQTTATTQTTAAESAQSVKTAATAEHATAVASPATATSTPSASTPTPDAGDKPSVIHSTATPAPSPAPGTSVAAQTEHAPQAAATSSETATASSETATAQTPATPAQAATPTTRTQEATTATAQAQAQAAQGKVQDQGAEDQGQAQGQAQAQAQAKPQSPSQAQPEALQAEGGTASEGPSATPQANQPTRPGHQPDVKLVETQEGSGIVTVAHDGPVVKVVGRVDIDKIDTSTRPSKKPKEERGKKDKQPRSENVKKYKEAFLTDIKGGVAATSRNASSDQGAATSSTDAGGRKKKRERIKNGKVDITDPTLFQSGDRTSNGSKSGSSNAGTRTDGGRSARGNRDNTRSGKGATVSRQDASEEDNSRKVKERLAFMESNSKNKGAEYRKKKRERVSARTNAGKGEGDAESKTLKLTEFVTVNELASMMDVPVTSVISTCMSVGVMVSINQRLDSDTINLVADEFGYNTEYVSAQVAQAIVEEADAEEDLEPRAPIVTVMGHVDHGKTSLLDYIRKSNVIAGEAGGITQHIGAYNVTLEDGRKITFLDTPGHEAFTAMRARGAKVTDVAIIIVAADDSVMPQTKEAINHAMAAGVPSVFAINKIDKPGANPEKIKEELAAMNFLVEDWGGKYQSQDISAKKGIGVNELMEKVLLEAEMLELKANPNRHATGSIIESSLDNGRGYVATVLVSNGTLKVGDIVLAGTNYGRVKAMFNERNQRIKEAHPAEPALILGLNGAPAAGDTFHVFETEQEAREITGKREQLQREQGLRTQKRIDLAEMGRRLALGDFHELNIIVKGDVDGSVEALSDSLIKLSTEHIQVNVIHKGVGQISESDVSLASASKAIIVGFQVRPSGAAVKLAEQEGVDIRKYSVIYDAIEEVKAAMVGMLAPTVKEQVTATLEVREVFNISKVGMVAGAMVKTGKIKRADRARLIRDGIVIFTGSINALKRFKDDVKEVGSGFECGISLVACNDIRTGDVIESFEEVEVERTLS